MVRGSIFTALPYGLLNTDTNLGGKQMENFEYQGWTFEYNKGATTEYYANHHDDCSCASCRNFHKNIHEMPHAQNDYNTY